MINTDNVPVNVTVRYAVSSPEHTGRPKNKVSATILEMQIADEVLKAERTWQWQQLFND